VIRRNRFWDEQDIVTTYNAKETRIRGHPDPDANTFRVIGLGVPWIIVGGRTGLTAGQSKLFLSLKETNERDRNPFSKLHNYKFFDKGAYAIGSVLGTQDHQRIMYTSFDDHSGAKAVIIIADASDSGRKWRINRPTFNQHQKSENGYMLTAPDGNTLKVNFLTASPDL